MKINVPGFPTQYVDEAPPVEEVKPEEVPVSVEEAIRLANARQATQVLDYTRKSGEESPLVDTAKALFAPPDNVSQVLENGAAQLGETVPFDVVNVPTPAEGVLQPATVPADEVGAGVVTAENTVVAVNADELLQ